MISSSHASSNSGCVYEAFLDPLALEKRAPSPLLINTVCLLSKIKEHNKYASQVLFGLSYSLVMLICCVAVRASLSFTYL